MAMAGSDSGDALTGFVSAIVLPIALFLIQRLLTQVS